MAQMKKKDYEELLEPMELELNNVARWLQHTQQVKPGTTMPQLGVVAQDARDIAAYLATLD